MVEPVNSNVLPIYVALKFVLGSDEDRADELLVGQPLKDLLVGEVLPSVEADHKFVVVRGDAGDGEPDFVLENGYLVESSLLVVLVVVLGDDDLDLLELVLAVVQFHQLLAAERVEPVERGREVGVGDGLDLLVVLYVEVLAGLLDLVEDPLGVGGQHLLVELLLLPDLLLLLGLLGNQLLVESLLLPPLVQLPHHQLLLLLKALHPVPDLDLLVHVLAHVHQLDLAVLDPIHNC